MIKSSKYILGLMTIFSLATIVMTKTEIDFVEDNFLRIITDFDEPQVSKSVKYTSAWDVLKPLAPKLAEEKYITNSTDTKINPPSSDKINTPNFNLPSKQYNDFDMYVLSIQWGNTLCLTSPFCNEKIKSISKNIFTMHGLWPSYSHGAAIPKCNLGEDIKIKKDGSSIFRLMDSLWLSYNTQNIHFWSHEYNKHGLCFSQKYNFKDPIHYFKFSLDIFKKHNMDQLLTRVFRNPYGLVQFKLNELKSKIEAVIPLAFELYCQIFNGKNYLQEIRFFFDLNLTPKRNHRFSGKCEFDKPVYVEFH